MAENAATRKRPRRALRRRSEIPVFDGDPFPLYKVLRATNPVVQLGEGFWGVAKYDECCASCATRRRSRRG